MNKDDILRELCPPEASSNEKWDTFAQTAYSPGVYITNWWYERETYPKDYDAYCPPGDIRRSTYNRLGSMVEDEYHWLSETHQALRDGRGDPSVELCRKQRHPKPGLSFLSYFYADKTRKDISKEEAMSVLPVLPKEKLTLRYITTNKASYKWVHTLPKI